MLIVSVLSVVAGFSEFFGMMRGEAGVARVVLVDAEPRVWIAYVILLHVSGCSRW